MAVQYTMCYGQWMYRTLGGLAMQAWILHRGAAHWFNARPAYQLRRRWSSSTGLRAPTLRGTREAGEIARRATPDGWRRRAGRQQVRAATVDPADFGPGAFEPPRNAVGHLASTKAERDGSGCSDLLRLRSRRPSPEQRGPPLRGLCRELEALGLRGSPARGLREP